MIHFLFLTAMLPALSGLLVWMIPSRKLAVLSSNMLAAATAVNSLWLCGQAFAYGPYASSSVWVEMGGRALSFGVGLDRASALLFMVVSLIATLVQVFSRGYMHGERHIRRYFSMLGLFTSAMLFLLLADNLVQMYLFWELVGFCSYQLIGFWREKKSATNAANKAFILNRVGDAGFLVGILALYAQYGTLELSAIAQLPSALEQPLAQLAVFGLMCGAIAKSAQFPLSVWLPDAMEGPTPVSALIHAATMVAAGVYLMFRVSFLFTPQAAVVLTAVGVITALLGGLSALVQYDIKRVLAFSTISQLGYMMAAIGMGGASAAMFHLYTHAFFKAGLFLGAGSVIHSMYQVSCETCKSFQPQDIRWMGGLRKYMPMTALGFGICAMALAGVPLFSGFLSKDAILFVAANYAQQGTVLGWFPFAGLLLVGVLTAFYMGRLCFRVFFGEFPVAKACQSCYTQPHEVHPCMYAPVLLLALLSFGLFYSLNPFSFTHAWVWEVISPLKGDMADALGVELTSVSAAALGIALAAYAYLYRPSVLDVFRIPFLKKLLQRFFFLDAAWMGLARVARYIAGRLSDIPHIDDYVIATTLHVSTSVRRFDNGFVDLLIRYIGVAGLIFAHIVSAVDRYVVDGLVALIGLMARGFGRLLRGTQQGNAQVYLGWMVLLFVLGAWVLLAY